VRGTFAPGLPAQRLLNMLALQCSAAPAAAAGVSWWTGVAPNHGLPLAVEYQVALCCGDATMHCLALPAGLFLVLSPAILMIESRPACLLLP
jgi:hypothetical protein